ncbi:type II toxin-antitoxin system HicB family antitoxin [Consotaella salsifontis]|uniref:HicB_like antitoxin of toxin-antitoxin system n=1 Tax=Consotaella salsifontis TaxID=1365950 RepID=A0A1T4RV51_9HYPH|nr:type II toxin-antitoxin system HicB family antitoxin [Consotaella salsifontis]SKA19860.1 HicB_like antitoxin of toxin-antitoxin system [Consotaella salsifontis]
MTTRYLGLLDGGDGAYGIAFPDAPGCTAMGKTIDEAIANAASALAEWASREGAPAARTAAEMKADPDVVEQLEGGSAFVVVPLIAESGRSVRANLSIDAGLLAAIDEAANAVRLTRSAFLASAARAKILSGV